MGKMLTFARSYLVYSTTLLLLISLIPNCPTATVAPTTRSTTGSTTGIGNESNGSELPTTIVKQQTKSDTTPPVTASTVSAGQTKTSTGASSATSSTGMASSTDLKTKSTTVAGTLKSNPTTTPSPESASTGATSGVSSSDTSLPRSTTLSASISSIASSPESTTKNGSISSSSGSTPSTQAASTTTVNNTASTSIVAPTNGSATTTVLMTSSSTAATQSPSTASAGTTKNASVVTNAPTTMKDTGSTTQAVTTSSPSTEATKNASVVTNAPTTMKDTGSTTQAVTTSSPSTEGSTSTPLVKTSQTSSLSTTGSPTSTVVSSQTSASTTSPTSTQSSTVKPSTASPSSQFVYISEIMMDKTGIFQTIEIRISDQLNLNHYAIVLVDGETSKTHTVIYLNSTGLAGVNNGLRTFQFNSTLILPSKGIGIAIYDTNLIDNGEGKGITQDWVINTQGVIDALVIGKTYAGISTSLIDTLTPGVNPFILDPSKYGKEMTISRCSSDSLRSTEMYALIHPSMGELNDDKCNDRQTFHSTLSLKIKKLNCGVLKAADNQTSVDIMHEVMKLIVKEVNKRCKCGFTRMHIIDPLVRCCGGSAVEMKFVAPNKVQDDEFTDSYKSFIRNTSSISIDKETFDLDQSCLTDCCKTIIQPITKDDSSRNVKVSVAVIITLLVLFLIIVLVVYMYMRKKKLAVQQFRMSKLEEDEEDFDDMTVGFPTDDRDEFVGGQEATFDRRA